MSRTSNLSPENLLRFLQVKSEPVSANDIARGLHLGKSDRRPLFKILAKLKKRNAIEELPGGRYRVARRKGGGKEEAVAQGAPRKPDASAKPGLSGSGARRNQGPAGAPSRWLRLRGSRDSRAAAGWRPFHPAQRHRRGDAWRPGGGQNQARLWRHRYAPRGRNYRPHSRPRACQRGRSLPLWLAWKHRAAV